MGIIGQPASCPFPHWTLWTPDRVKDERERRGWSQRELCRRAGLGAVVVSHYESGRGQRVSYETILKIEKALRDSEPPASSVAS